MTRRNSCVASACAVCLRGVCNKGSFSPIISNILVLHLPRPASCLLARIETNYYHHQHLLHRYHHRSPPLHITLNLSCNPFHIFTLARIPASPLPINRITTNPYLSRHREIKETPQHETPRRSTRYFPQWPTKRTTSSPLRSTKKPKKLHRLRRRLTSEGEDVEGVAREVKGDV